MELENGQCHVVGPGGLLLQADAVAGAAEQLASRHQLAVLGRLILESGAVPDECVEGAVDRRCCGVVRVEGRRRRRCDETGSSDGKKKHAEHSRGAALFLALLLQGSRETGRVEARGGGKRPRNDEELVGRNFHAISFRELC